MGSTPIHGIPFADPTDLVRDWPALSEDVALAIEAALEDISVPQKRIEAFTGDGTWTVPAGVTYAIAHITGGGGGGASHTGSNATDGGDSSVAFASGTVTAEGGGKASGAAESTQDRAQPVPPNSGIGGGSNTGGNGFTDSARSGRNGAHVVRGAAVTPGASIAIIVGNGGQRATGGNQGVDGASGLVLIEFFEEV